MLMDTVIRDFVLYLCAELGYSAQTARSYHYDLRQLCEFLEAHEVPLDPRHVTTRLVREWVIEMYQRGLSSNTVARHLYALRSFWRYLTKVGIVDDDPLGEVSVPRRTRSLPKYLGPEELQQILDASQGNRTARCAFRNYAMMAMMIFTGMRRGELINLRLPDVSLREKVIRVRGKGSKQRIIPLVDEVVQAVADWLEFRPANCAHDYLFTTFHGNRIYPTSMQRIWRDILEKSGIEASGVTLHTLRHSCATLLLQSGQCSLVEIQQILGHSRLDTTAVYLHFSDGGLRDAVHAHPLLNPGKSWQGSQAGDCGRM